MISHRIICILIGYAFGLFQTGYFVGKAHGIDIRTQGSKNAGSTNTLRVLGTKAGLIALLGDAFKCVIAVTICKLIFASEPDYKMLYTMYAAMGVILGHNFPFYMNFKGGKGIAATAGLLMSLPLPFLIVGILVFFPVFFTTHMVSVGSLLVYTCFLIQMFVMGQMGLLNSSAPVLIEIYIITVFLTVMAFYRHKANIGRILKGEEKKVYLSKSKKV